MPSRNWVQKIGKAEAFLSLRLDQQRSISTGT